MNIQVETCSNNSYSLLSLFSLDPSDTLFPLGRCIPVADTTSTSAAAAAEEEEDGDDDVRVRFMATRKEARFVVGNE